MHTGVTPPAPLNTDITKGSRIAIVDGSAGLRLLLAAFIKSRMPDADIEEIDPFSQTMYGAGITAGQQGSVVVLGGLGTQKEVFDALRRMRSKLACPPIIILVSAELVTDSSIFIEAGAYAVLRKNALSFTRLHTHLLRALARACTEHQVAEQTPDYSEILVPAYGKFSFVYEGERQVLEIDGYRYLSHLSSGQLAQVFFAEHIASGERAVIKVQTNAPIQQLAALATICKRALAINANHNHHFVGVHDSGIAGQFAYVVLEFLSNGDLRQHTKSELTVIEKIACTVQLLDALSSLHQCGYVHADLKPESVFFRPDGTAVLIDFNISTPFGEAVSASLTGDVLGTPNYMSPEQGAGLTVQASADIYSVGIVLFEMLTSNCPFAADTPVQTIYRHLHDEIPLLPLPLRYLQPTIDQMLAKNPLERYQTAEAAKLALLPYIDVPVATMSAIKPIK